MKVFTCKSPGYTDNSYVKSHLTNLDRVGVEHTGRPNSGEGVSLCVQWEPGVAVVRGLKNRGVEFFTG